MSNVAIFEYLVAGSTLSAVIPMGCSVSFPSVLLRQLASNDSSIQLDWDDTSWIGSIHGIAAVPSILMPAFMQWRGRKLAFIIACLISIIGWMITYTASSFTSILISESLLGFGSQSVMAVGLLSMSEMLSPRIRTVSMGLYLVMQTLGMALVGVIGNYMDWRTLALVVSAPLVLVTALVVFMWPESPSWLAYKGEFDKCEKAFKRLRGTGDYAKMELEELILAQKENLSSGKRGSRQSYPKYFCQTLGSRDFYLPALHLFIYLLSMYWTGALATMIYSSDIIKRATHIEEAVPFGVLLLNIAMFSGCVVGIGLLRYFEPKKLFLSSMSCSVTTLLINSVVHYSQSVGLLTKESYICLYLLVVFIFIACIGFPIVLTVTAELMPVKHRGIGGPFYVISSCIMHASVLKISPYLYEYINLYGTWLIYAINATLNSLFIWKFIPDTNGKTLQQLENYYAYGNINKRRGTIHAQESLSEIKSLKA